MNVPESLDHICGLLAEQFGDLGEEAARRLRLWMSGDLPFTYPEVLAQHLREDYLDLLIEVFWQELPFGTGGRRGPVGYGANPYHSSYDRTRALQPSSRSLSRSPGHGCGCGQRCPRVP